MIDPPKGSVVPPHGGCSMVTATPQSTVACSPSSGPAPDWLRPGPPHGGHSTAPWRWVDPAELADPESAVFAPASGRMLVFVEEPHLGLAAALEPQPDVDVQLWLARWLAGARNLLRLAQRQPQRCVFVDVGEARQEPAAFAALCLRELGAEPSLPLPSPRAVDASHWIATLAVASEPSAHALWRGLLSCCVPLAGAQVAGMPPAPTLPSLAAPLLAAWRQQRAGLAERQAGLEQRAGEAESRALQLARQRDELQADIARREEAAGRQFEQARGELARAQAEALARHQESVAALQRVDALQEELGRSVAALDAAQARLADLADREAQASQAAARVQRLLDQAHERGAQLEQALHASEGAARQAADEGELLRLQRRQLLEEIEGHFQERSRLEQAVSAEQRALAEQTARSAQLAADIERLVADAAAARDAAQGLRAQVEELRRAAAVESARHRQEVELLLEQLQQAQEELEDQFRECRRREGAQNELRAVADALEQRLQALERARSAARAARGEPVVDLVQVGREHGRAPHLHLELQLQGLRLGTVAVPETSLRLIEHCGHPGLVLFSQASRWLGSWRETGREGERPFMALVPSDAPGRLIFERLPSRDWLAVCAVLELVHARLCEPDVQAHARWRDVAARLRAQVSELAPRVRYDDLHRRAVGEGAHASRGAIVLQGVVFGARRFDEVALRLQADSPDGAVEILPDAAGRLPLFEVDGVADIPPGSGLRLVLGPDAARSHRERSWARMGGADQEFVLGLLEALCGAAQEPTSRLDLSPAENRLLSAAAHEAARLSSGPPVARRVLRRLSQKAGSLARGVRSSA